MWRVVALGEAIKLGQRYSVKREKDGELKSVCGGNYGYKKI